MTYLIGILKFLFATFIVWLGILAIAAAVRSSQESKWFRRHGTAYRAWLDALAKDETDNEKEEGDQ